MSSCILEASQIAWSLPCSDFWSCHIQFTFHLPDSGKTIFKLMLRYRQRQWGKSAGTAYSLLRGDLCITQNCSVLSKSKIRSDDRRFPWETRSVGEEKRESLRTIDREGCKPHPYAFAISLLVCPPSPCWKARQEVSLANWTWSQMEKAHLLSSIILQGLENTC